MVVRISLVGLATHSVTKGLRLMRSSSIVLVSGHLLQQTTTSQEPLISIQLCLQKYGTGGDSKDIRITTREPLRLEETFRKQQITEPRWVPRLSTMPAISDLRT